MKNSKKVLLFVLINVIVLAFTIALSLVPIVNFNKANNWQFENQKLVEKDGVTTTQHTVDIATMSEALESQEQKDVFSNLLNSYENKIYYTNQHLMHLYIIVAVLLSIAIIAIGIILKYKTDNKIYAISFICSGIITFVYHIAMFFYLTSMLNGLA